MSDQGVIKYVDDCGRIVIPKAMRDIIGIDNGDAAEVALNDKGEVVIKRRKEFEFSREEIQEIEQAAKDDRLIILPEWPVEKGMITKRYEIIETMQEKNLILIKDRGLTIEDDEDIEQVEVQDTE